MSDGAQTLLYLITHAHTQPVQEVDCTRWDLSPAGEEQARTLARQPFWSRVDRVILSGELKTRLTVAPLLNRQSLPVHVDARFDELARGGWVDDYSERVALTFAQPDVSAGGWEPARHALERFLAGVDDLRHRFRGETLALVGHGLTFSLYRAHLLGRSRVSIDDWRGLSFTAVALAKLNDSPTPDRLLHDFEPAAFPMARGTH